MSGQGHNKAARLFGAADNRPKRRKTGSEVRDFREG
jgi:hypothetical protein